ncbi:ATP-binding protein [Candidatus Micrarchaeota archaeon]|nr:ATP-binding protein [Candidatus Micrarchaeota archaeon]
MGDFEHTGEVLIPENPLERIIGQERAVRIAGLVAQQHRHLLLVGPPGTGKSLIAKAISSLLPNPKFEISVLHNSERSEKPLLSVRAGKEILLSQKTRKEYGKEIDPRGAPVFVAEKLGFRCKRCGSFSPSLQRICPSCGADKYLKYDNPFEDLIIREQKEETRVHTTRIGHNGKEELVVYEKTEDGRLLIITKEDMVKMKKDEKNMRRKILVPLKRKTFVEVVAASETELLGDVKHDPYGDHPEIGTPAYLRVVAGAIHEAHEGVLYIDELATLGTLQKYILTSMQERRFPITGRNPTSAGAIIKVDKVPCDFILVGAMNMNDLPLLNPALRSRIRGNGYEILVNTHMEDTPENRKKMAQFAAQEILMDGRIPNASYGAVKELIEEGKRIARKLDEKSGITLRLRKLSGILKLAGDLALDEGLIEQSHIKKAIKESKTIEEQITERYDNWWVAQGADFGLRSKKGSETV